MKILIVEDSPDNRMLIAHLLRQAGYADLVMCVSAADAYGRLQLDANQDAVTDIDLILMDIVMPEVDGVTACRHIKRQPRFQDVPIIMVTAQTDIDSLKRAFNAGAMDYITKPFKKPELLARIRSALALKRETDRRKARETEIATIGARIQRSLLQGRPPADVQGLRVAALSIPSQRIDGDFYDFFRPDPSVLDILIADVMGKGVPAALLGAAVKTHFLRAHNRLVPQSNAETRQTPPSPETIVAFVHREMAEELMELEAFATLCYARLDPAGGRLTLIDCGHTRTIHYLGEKKQCRWLEGNNLPLGVMEDEVLEPMAYSIAPGDLLLFYSDGLTEAESESGEMFGEQRLLAHVCANAHLDPETLVDRLCGHVRDFAQMGTLVDDLTCVAVKMVER